MRMTRVGIVHSGSKRDCPAGWCHTKPKDLLCLGCCKTSGARLRRIVRAAPDVLLLHLPSVDGAALDCARQVRAEHPQLPLIFISDRIDAEELKACVRSGARGFLVEPLLPDSLEEVVRCVAAGHAVFSRAAHSAALALQLPVSIDLGSGALSRRQEYVLQHLAAGAGNKDIAAGLGICEGTVHAHVHRLCKKLQVPDKAAAVSKLRDSEVLLLFNLLGSPSEASEPLTRRQLRHLFSNENACRKLVFKLRWSAGFSCPECGHHAAWRVRRGVSVCEQCRRQISITSGTLMHHTHLPLRVWFRAIWELALHPNSSARSLMRAARITNYKTAWMC
jgi:DNA-binding NarL/FixJ family response regulator